MHGRTTDDKAQPEASRAARGRAPSWSTPAARVHVAIGSAGVGRPRRWEPELRRQPARLGGRSERAGEERDSREPDRLKNDTILRA
jgi:hypothetical protein